MEVACVVDYGPQTAFCCRLIAALERARQHQRPRPPSAHASKDSKQTRGAKDSCV